MLKVRSILVLAGLVALAACSGSGSGKPGTVIRAGPPGDADALAACQGLIQTPPAGTPAGIPAGATSVAAAYDSTVGQVNRWRKAYYANIGWEPQLRGDPSNGGDTASKAKETVCFLNGQWYPSAPPGAGPFVLDLEYIGPTGTVIDDGVGNTNSLPFERPSDTPAHPVPAVPQGRSGAAPPPPGANVGSAP